MKRRTEITIETSRRLLVRRTINRRAWCDRCRAEVRMINTNEAAMLLNVSSRVIYQRIEGGSVHFSDETEGLLICEESLQLGP
ncbi:MAG TPA: hypothetical protein VE961_02430 [Pyrinomonadaceae bacterium]|nr:hypothetical protein [Pyrinomonadaceae bacterium]